MTIYQEEMQRKAQHYGCITSYDEADQLLLISHKGVHRGLMELMEKLQTAYPHLKDNPPTFDDGENPILNM